ncbi:H-NS family nucleoid-associated regulatory protein [Yoonia sp. R2331]|uniref:H-NS histone family protein n=1 Tax=Yoonia sp. R2331 TaxID=3237238 RepID=UPI0034E5FCB9
MKKSELKAMSRKELEKLKVTIDEVLEGLAERDRKAALAAAEKAAAEHGFSLADLASDAPKKRGPKPGKKAKAKSVPKFANPADKSQTWTGKGRQPEWYKAEIAKGTKPEAMAI